MDIAAIIVAAGRGTRAGGGLPKQWRDLAGRPVARWTLEAFAHLPRIILVIHPDDRARAEDVSEGLPVTLIDGAADRAGSVRAGLEALAETPPDRVLIHDVARPCVSRRLIDAVVEALDRAPGAAPALPVTDALWTGAGDIVTGTQDRTGLFRAQTPQGFRYAEIRAAHAAHPGGAADDVEVARAAGLDVAIVPGEERNLKITGPDDFARAHATMKEDAMDIRLGNGYDVHRFGPGDHVVLCGVTIPHGRGLQGHSDADVGMHAVTDALYGAMAEGDIGRHFPPTDPQWKGAASEIFLRHAVDLARSRGFTVSNVDLTLICERPKIGPHAPDMTAEMARITGIAPDRISIKATTSERLGFTGREEGIAAIATATLVRS
ncbi:MAG: bifunctional 2-C-methyl-D-erythritol 4-phosphate cytidylyltransferase/2-C-methyl-D-erythritol 2,4-cyclodiphosphate synthase [Rhodobacteraceae bacterium]|jgi:2-C-methyl-D-erythritol 4-phosphate cytidylyltransferase/2-C-methyl-D-erythritol 2,4-cyclodiphosphate synthase|uniref:Bifunctional enzyme IspD/IspF n=1 Tax=Salipiger profundus TaxID=1229727 RepID=A0A1U7D816_9RHOB|nr:MULTISPECIES: bifunctional 2-C-methyl-D-erythritol 4-phosphate cytidylyltransferase/2-C-methyl-D-erythritol 2,4-cyclodiphosphate synthase [Salipiger]APX24317.1 2-C-methyl-D-erythritol 2,4-cyclodiphosphate synthase [Salipiger profundus]MAB06677.1 bifunctional 2-C-methyl-D-erythritol 4-phosphate cytidylyltransferase/2-C-methyl-D-erythritol 2,4-cyclodiphosphate synthase [Paracoccaceae bacterium]GFZ95948.1 bifunctional enzyme IspD/IspF [Salipiger profundus]SFB84087.1 2-C-methyl-D-erythritol 2,4-